MTEPRRFEPQVQVSASSYRDRLSITSFINANYQIRDCLQFNPRRVLIIGTGLGLEASILRGFGLDVTVVDIDPALSPDVVASVDNLSMFENKSFDVVIAAHVLEHLPYEFLDRCCAEISRVAEHALIYLPFACWVPQVTIAIEPLFRKTVRLRIPLFWKTHRFNGEHYWEIGTKGCSLQRVTESLKKHFDINDAYHNWDWRYSYNFVLDSTSHA